MPSWFRGQTPVEQPYSQPDASKQEGKTGVPPKNGVDVEPGRVPPGTPVPKALQSNNTGTTDGNKTEKVAKEIRDNETREFKSAEDSALVHVTSLQNRIDKDIDNFGDMLLEGEEESLVIEQTTSEVSAKDLLSGKDDRKASEKQN